MTDRPDYKHVRHERATRERLPAPLNADPEIRGYATAWCGANADGQWFFQDADHVLLYLSGGGGAAYPCPACLRRMRDVIDAELGGGA